MTTMPRRGLCPGLAAPMPTGDGLLARLPQAGALAPAALAAICRAAIRHGNGMIEATARGSLQARGLTPDSAPRFAAACAEAGVMDPGGPPVVASPAGAAGPGALADLSPLVAALRAAIPAFAGRVAPKVAIVVDDGGALHLDALAADIRLRAISRDLVVAGLGGDGRSTRWLGTVARSDAPAAVLALLDALAARGREARGEDLAEAGLPDGMRPAPVPAMAARDEARFVGTHGLADGSAAVGLAPAFGQADGAALAELAGAALEAGATGIMPAPGRVLLAIGLAADRAAGFVEAAGRLGFITRADDPRRRVIACAGAPACSAALMPARAIAGDIAEAARPLLAAGGRVHVSGCAKGCASRDAAALTIIGTPAGCAIVRNGRVGDRPEELVPLAALVDRLTANATAEVAVPA